MAFGALLHTGGSGSWPKSSGARCAEGSEASREAGPTVPLDGVAGVGDAVCVGHELGEVILCRGSGVRPRAAAQRRHARRHEHDPDKTPHQPHEAIFAERAESPRNPLAGMQKARNTGQIGEWLHPTQRPDATLGRSPLRPRRRARASWRRRARALCRPRARVEECARPRSS